MWRLGSLIGGLLRTRKCVGTGSADAELAQGTRQAAHRLARVSLVTIGSWYDSRSPPQPSPRNTSYALRWIQKRARGRRRRTPGGVFLDFQFSHACKETAILPQ